MPEDNEYLPDTIDLPVVEPPLRLEPNATLSQAVQSDLTMANDMLHILHSLWHEVRSVPTACKLVSETFKAIEARRNILSLPYGYQNQKSRQNTFEPID